LVQILSVDDPDDPRLAPYRDVRERDLVGRQGRFIAEGVVVLRAVARGGRHRLLSLLVDQKRIEALAPILAELAPETSVYSAGQAVIDAVAGFHLHRGVLGLGERAAEPSPEALLADAAERAVVLVLMGVSNHDNIGGVFRNAAAFGAHGVLLDADCCDPLYRKAIRVSVGATLVTPFARLARDADPVALLARFGFTSFALSPSGETALSQVVRPPRAAALFGAEGPGLPDAILARTRTVRIAMAGGFDSLNVATTSGIVLHQLAD
jgi:tRNA G18 (ribose-2'-O)-methylase SpoU